MFWDYTYTDEQVFWDINTDNWPVIIKTRDDSNSVKEYIMVAPLINLMSIEYSFDQQNIISLSSNSSTIKYMLAYKNFDPHTDFGVAATTAIFNPTLKC